MGACSRSIPTSVRSSPLLRYLVQNFSLILIYRRVGKKKNFFFFFFSLPAPAPPRLIFRERERSGGGGVDGRRGEVT